MRLMGASPPWGRLSFGRFALSNAQIFVEHLSESFDITFQRREANSRSLNQEEWKTNKKRLMPFWRMKTVLMPRRGTDNSFFTSELEVLICRGFVADLPLQLQETSIVIADESGILPTVD
jgi:hypothetical protein